MGRTPSPVIATYLITLAGWGHRLCPVDIAALLDTAQPTEDDAEVDGGSESSQEQETPVDE